MKLLQVTQIREYEAKYFVQAGSQLIQQGLLGGKFFNNPPSPPYPQQVINTESKRRYCFLLDDFKYMVEIKDQNTNTQIFFKNNESIFVEETIEQIQKLIHNLEFNNKMDEILK